MKRVAIQPIINCLLIVIMTLGFLSPAQQTVSAVSELTIEPITWNVIGLDSNNVNVGPNTFPVGARVCNNGDTPSGALAVNFVWDSSNAYIDISYGNTLTLTHPGLAGGECTDFYYEVAVTRDSNAYDTTRRYHITVEEAGGLTLSTPTPRELYVEHLISQSRNNQVNLELSTTGEEGSFETFAAGETLTLVKGSTYFLRLTAFTATNGYEQIESYLNLPNIFFRVLSVETDYGTDVTNLDMLYGDGCTWENDPYSPNYRSCLGVGKHGGTVITTYEVYIVDYRSGDPTPVNGMIYDFSGSSYHYNADYSGEARDLYNLDPERIPFTKTFVPDAIVPGDISTATFNITNPSSLELTSVNFTDSPFPPGMTVAATPNLTYTGCGTSPAPASVTAGATGIDFTNITLAPYGTCVIKVDVTATDIGPYTNTTGNLIFTMDGNTYTGITATDQLTVAASVRVCTSNTTAAQWTVPAGAVAPPDIAGGFPTVRGPGVGTATSLGVGTSFEVFDIDSTTFTGNPVWAMTGKLGSLTRDPVKYFEFRVDTTFYETVSWSFWLAELKNGPTSFDITYTPSNGTESPLATISAVTNSLSQHTYLIETGYLPAGITVFKVYPYNASNSGKDAVAIIDDIRFSGTNCDAPPPSIIKSFNPDSIKLNSTSQLTFTVANTSTIPLSGPLTGVSFNDVLPVGLKIGSGSTSNSCGGTLTATADTTSISLNGVSMASGATCTVVVPVVGIAQGIFDNYTNRITSIESGENKTSSGIGWDDITVIGPPVITKDFTEETILTGRSTPLTFTITNPNPTTTLTGLSFTDTLPTGLTVATGSVPGTCGTLSTTADQMIQLSGASLAPYSSCSFEVTVTGASASTPIYTNTTSTVTSNESDEGDPATDTLYVRDPMPRLSLLKQVGTSATGPWYKYLVVTPGTDLYYNLTVENTGDVPLTAVTLSDSTVDVSSCAPVDLETASSPTSEPIASCVVGSITSLAGEHENTASSSGSHNSAPVLSNNSTATYATPDVSLVKTSVEKYYTAASQLLHYTYQVTNNGATLPGLVTITDDKTTVACPLVTTVGDFDNWFELDESVMCSATYTTTAQDVDVVNLATAYAGGFASNEATVTVPKLPANFGHLPSSYENMNLYADDGARHITDSTANGTYLGATVPIEADGFNNPTFIVERADDGVTFRGTWTTYIGLARIGYHCPAEMTCYVNGWLDWDGNSQFDSQDWIVNNKEVSGTGTTEYSFTIPTGTNVDDGRVLHARFRVYSAYPGDAPLPNGQATNLSGQPTVGEVEDYEITLLGGTPIHTPVTLSYFRTVRNGNDVTFNWSTATETGNVGFNLYVGDETARTLINPELIGSKVVDSLSRQDYTFTATVSGNTFFLEDVSVVDEARVHGPFQLGKEYGDKTQNDVIDWDLIQGENNAKDTKRQRNLAPGLTVTNTTKAPTSALNFEVSKTGIYRVTYEMLKAAGYDLKGVQTAKIGLTSSGKAVPIYTFGGTAFGPGSYIEFYGQALDTLYTNTNIYTLQTNIGKPLGVLVDNKRVSRKTIYAESFIETLTVHNQKQYAQDVPGEDPWFDTSLLVYKTPKYWNLPFTINGLSDSASQTELKLTVWGTTDWPATQDHRLQVSVNGISLADETFDGSVEKTLNLTIPAGVLIEGANTLRLTLPGTTGVKYEIQRLDQFSVSYPSRFSAQNGYLEFTSADAGFKVGNLPTNDVLVYRIDPSGEVIKLTPTVTTETSGTFTAAFLGGSSNSTYFVSAATELLIPEFEAASINVDLNKQAEYLIISHPDFIANLQPLVAARQSQYTVSVVDVTDLYTQYTYGVFDPDAIRQYIKYAAQNLGTKYVLLVGGDTFDYHNYTKQNSISFIPSLYASTGPVISFAPVDPLYTDFNGDNIPDLAIGRFPVRTAAELNLVIQKTLAYTNKDYGQSAIFASDKYDQGYSFKQISDSMVETLPDGWSVESVSLEDLDLSTVRTKLLNAMNAGTALVNFTGHSGPADWTFSGLFNQADVTRLTNAGRPFVVVQWGCWNNYYVYPNYNFLVQNFLFTGDKGAAAVLGATTLSEINSEMLLGELLTPNLVTPGMTLGQAVQDAKRQLSVEHPEMLDVLLGWSLMGDPALVIEP